ncbi:MAG: arginine--tRNA ligase [Patescibacteria group bacterium]
MILQNIIDLIKKNVNRGIEPEIFAPEQEKFGHYSTNAALKLAKAARGNPMITAGEIVDKISETAPRGFFEKIEIAPPGFINFWLSPKTLQNELKIILKQKQKYGSSNIKHLTSNILLEFLSANPTGPIHIGNGRGAFFGNALANILKFAGYKVKTEYYVNNARISEQIKNLGKTAVGESSDYPYVQSFYLNKNQKLKKQLSKLSSGEAGYELANHIQKLNRHFIEKKLQIKYDAFFNEESLFKSKEIESALKLLKNKKLTYEKDGALWFKAQNFGDSEDRVLVRSAREAGRAGAPTYFLTDLAYHINKFFKRKFGKAIDIWGADHHGYAPRLKFALKALGVKEELFEIIITQFVRLSAGGKEVKMSKRKGDIETLEKLIDEVGLDAARFFFLAHSAGSHIDFDIKFAKERSLKNPVYYVQYAYVRCGSIIRKMGNGKWKTGNLYLLKTREDLNLIRQLICFPKMIEDIAKNYQVHNLVRYALELSRAFHNFYEKERVIGASQDLAEARLALVKGVQIVLKNTLELLGISLPKRM